MINKTWLYITINDDGTFKYFSLIRNLFKKLDTKAQSTFLKINGAWISNNMHLLFH